MKARDLVILVSVLMFFISSDALCEDKFVPGEFLVKFKSGIAKQNAQKKWIMNDRALDALGKANSATINKSKMSDKRFGDVFKIKVAQGKDIEELARQFKKNPNVVWAMLNFYAVPFTNDQYYSQQYGLTKINTSKAWEREKGLEAIKIAVIDTGFNQQHPDLTNKRDGSILLT